MLPVPLSRGMLLTRPRDEANNHLALALDYSNRHNLHSRPAIVFAIADWSSGGSDAGVETDNQGKRRGELTSNATRRVLRIRATPPSGRTIRVVMNKG